MRTGYPASDEHPTSTRSSMVDSGSDGQNTFPQVIALNAKETIDKMVKAETIKSPQLYR